MNTITLGDKYRDTITGYEGTATARTEYLSGCWHVSIERADDKGKPQTEWFDSERLEHVDAVAYVDGGPPRSPGAPPPALPHP